MNKYCIILFLFSTSAFALPYKGWGRVAEKLIHDNVPEETVKSVFESEVFPEFDFVPFKLAPKEPANIYTGFFSSSSISDATECLNQLGEYANSAAQLFGVQKEVIVSFLFVETRCGKNTGKELVANRLARIANTGESTNLRRNYTELVQNNPGEKITLTQVEDRAKYLDKTFYPELLRLFQLFEAGRLNILELHGSVSGAFGLSQFLPRALWKYGVDGNKDGVVDIFNPVDAAYSVALYMAFNGWSDDLNIEEKRKVIWTYNKSEPYIDTILRLSKILSKTETIAQTSNNAVK